MPHHTNTPRDPERPNSADVPELPEFDDIHQDDDDVWHARHTSGTEIDGETWDILVARAVAARISASYNRTWGPG